eukprot:1145918-Pelagomonas_calceolata.AAC.7
MSAAFPHRQAPPGQHHPGGRSASPSHGPSHLQPAYPDRPLGSSSAICSEEALTRHRAWTGTVTCHLQPGQPNRHRTGSCVSMGAAGMAGMLNIKLQVLFSGSGSIFFDAASACQLHQIFEWGLGGGEEGMNGG